jgi:hypothetical protein
MPTGNCLDQYSHYGCRHYGFPQHGVVPYLGREAPVLVRAEKPACLRLKIRFMMNPIENMDPACRKIT